jgi:hypothetical protein
MSPSGNIGDQSHRIGGSKSQHWLLSLTEKGYGNIFHMQYPLIYKIGQYFNWEIGLHRSKFYSEYLNVHENWSTHHKIIPFCDNCLFFLEWLIYLYFRELIVNLFASDFCLAVRFQEVAIASNQSNMVVTYWIVSQWEWNIMIAWWGKNLYY